MNINCIVLAGGKGLRLGRDKALETIGGKSLIQRAVANLNSFNGDIIVVTDVERTRLGLADYPGVKIVTDVFLGKGPLVGIHSGLSVSGSFYNLVIACDMPFLNQPLLRFMTQLADGFDIVVPRLGDHLEPLHAVYGKRCLETIESMFREGDYQVNHLFQRVKVRYLTEEEINQFDPEHLSFFNINSRVDMARARELVNKMGGPDTDRYLSEVEDG